MTKTVDIQERLIQFADKIVTLCESLPSTTAAVRIAAQLMRSAIAPALYLLEAHLAETPAESINNLRIAVVALTASEIYLDSIIAGDMLPQNSLAPLITDCQQLQNILIAGIINTGKPLSHQPSNIDHRLTNYPTNYPTKGHPS